MEDKYLLVAIDEITNLAMVKMLFPNAKQISLSESDIEEKAQKYSEQPRGMTVSNTKIQGNTDRYAGYKQALKDLLK